MSKTRASLAAVLALAAGAVVSTSGCGDSTTDPAREYLGAWHYDDAKGSVACLGHDPVPESPEGNKVFGLGLDPKTPLVDLSPAPVDPHTNCNFVFSIDGPVATATPQQGCATTSGTVFTTGAWTFSLTSPTTAEEIGAAKLTFTLPDPTTNLPTAMSCDFTLKAHLTRVSKD